MKKSYELAAEVKPHERQLFWQETEYYGMIHFGMPTIINQEWSDGTVKPENFAPEEFSAVEWVKLFKDAGMKGLVLTVKHHDGFCLWSSQFTDYCVKNAVNWEVEERDIVKLVSEECQNQGLKFGIYITPLDRHEKTYGTGEAYNTYFKSLLSELLTNYGDIFYVRFDGVSEPIKGGYIQEYDFYGYYDLVRKLQPQAVIALCGPDVRWNGNEWGVCRKNEWSVIPKRYSIYEAINRGKQDGKGKDKKADTMELDIGGRKAIKNDSEFIWYPAEVCVSMRDGWYYHKSDEYTAKTKDKLLRLYYETVGSNFCFMLNVPPMKNGKFAEMETQILRAFGYDLNKMFAYQVSSIGEIKASSELSQEYSAENLFLDDKNKTWKPKEDDKNPTVTITLSEVDMFDKLVLMEHIKNGQHAEEYTVYADYGNGKWKKLYKGGIIGYKKIIKVRPVEVKAIKIVFNQYRPGLEMESILMF